MSRYKFHFEIAVFVSLLLHVAVIGGWEQRAMITRMPFFGKLAKTFPPHPSSATAKLIPTKPAEPVITFVEEPETRRAIRSRPQQFIETDQSQVTGEKPTDSKFYSDRSTVAANPTNPTGKTGDTPYLDGTETRMTSTADVTPKSGVGGIPLPPGPSHPAIRATPSTPGTPAAATAAAPAPLAPMANTKSAAPAPLLKPLPEEFNKPRTPEKTELAKNDAETKPEVKSEEKKPLAPGGVEKGTALEKPKPLPEEAWKAKEQEKLAMLTPPPQPKTVAMPPPPAPPEETPAGKPELSLRQPSPAAAPSPLLTTTAIPASPGSPGAEAAMGGGTGSAGSGSSREIAARKTKGTTVGVNRVGVAAFNVAESPFGAYDKQVVRAVQSRWYALIEQNGLYERAGEVTIHFKLMPDGSVADADVKTSTAGQILALFCQKAVVESAPFEPWPEELRTYLGNEPREVDFTFYY